MKYYEMKFNMAVSDYYDSMNINTIFASESNFEDLKYDMYHIKFNNIFVFEKIDFEYYPDIKFYYYSQENLMFTDYLNNISDLPILSNKVIDKFKENNIEGIEYIPIKLIDKKTEHINLDYSLIYIKNFIDAYDMSRTKHRYIEKLKNYYFDPMGIYLDKNKIKNYDIFRENKKKSIIYVSEKIKRIIEENNFTCFLFKEVKV